MEKHPVREQVVREMHLRRWPLLEVPCMIHQWVTLVEPEDRKEESAILLQHADAAAEDSPHRAGKIGADISFTWERHNEGSSLTLFSRVASTAPEAEWAISPEVEDALAWVARIPGKVIRATRIYVTADDSAAEKLLGELEFNRPELVSCHFESEARLWSDFRLREDGFGRLLIAANGVDPRDLTRAAQRLQELGNYRNKALLGLPAAKAAWPKLDDIEVRLTGLANRLTDGNERDDLLMEELSRLSIELIAVATQVGYRLSATRAYGRLVDERLAQLETRAIPGYASLNDFTQRRFLPAIRTCAALQDREEQLSERATKLSSLLRARIETRLENQNAELLHSMERSNTMQVRLQQLVEGLSVVAVSYYALGLIGYFLKVFPESALGIAPSTLLGILVLPLVIALWLALRVAKRKLLARSD